MVKKNRQLWKAAAGFAVLKNVCRKSRLKNVFRRHTIKTGSKFRTAGRGLEMLREESGMEQSYCETREQAEQEMEYYRKIFDVVRLLGADNFEKLKRQEEGDNPEMVCQCYDFWKRGRICDNCISRVVFTEKIQKSKLELIDEEVYQVIARYVEIDGEPYVMELIRKMDDDSLLDSIGRTRLLNKLVHYNEELYKDALTGAYNRRYFEERVKKTTQQAGVAVIDIDDFKLCNDTYGHQAGDAALYATVDAIRQSIRKTDSLIRYGGDEFLLVMPEIAEEIFLDKLQQMQRKIRAVKMSQFPRMRISVSIGGVIAENETIENAVMRADQLMYQAKAQKNTVVTEENAIDETEDVGVYMERNKVKHQILIVDDSLINRMILKEILEEDFRILEAENGAEAVELLGQYETGISLVLLDINMPVMDGFEVLKIMNQDQLIEDIPVIMISSEDSGETVRRAYELGVSDYINRPYDAKVVYQRVYNTIKLYAKQRKLMSLVASQIYEKEKYNQMMISILSHIVEFRNGESGLHVMHINVLTGMLLEQLAGKNAGYSISGEDQHLIAMASALHDIGKIGIEEKIINKPGKLTPEEFEVMKSHTTIGEAMLESLDMFQNEKLVQIAKKICRWHHERYDGNGYPDGLKGDEIPIAAQVVSLVDVYDALVSDRVYKKAYSHETAIKMILNGECGAFNPVLLECLVEIQDRIGEKLRSVTERVTGK